MFVPLQDVQKSFINDVANIYGSMTFITNSVAGAMFFYLHF